jgi:hypothetical protein
MDGSRPDRHHCHHNLIDIMKSHIIQVTEACAILTGEP